MPRSIASVWLHVVWATKHRKCDINPVWQSKLYGTLVDIAEKNGCGIDAVGGVRDHVHCLLSFSRTIAISDLLRELKSRSARWIRDTVPDMTPFQWQEGYGVFSVSYSLLAVVDLYIRNQETHHNRFSFNYEMDFLAKKHNLEWESDGYEDAE